MADAGSLRQRARLTNRVLASIPAKEYGRLQARLEPVVLRFGQVLYEPGKAIRHVYFPVDCLISLLTAVDKRRTLEVGMVGSEGMAGMQLISYARGKIRILDVKGLKASSCSCYQIVKAVFDRAGLVAGT
jgi:hypothetical protein